MIPLQRAMGLVHDGSHHIQYSDFFDFYPWVYHEGHAHLVCNTLAQVPLHEVRAFRGQTSPLVSHLNFDHMDVDTPLLNALLARWRVRYGARCGWNVRFVPAMNIIQLSYRSLRRHITLALDCAHALQAS